MGYGAVWHTLQIHSQKFNAEILSYDLPGYGMVVDYFYASIHKKGKPSALLAYTRRWHTIFSRCRYLRPQGFQIPPYGLAFIRIFRYPDPFYRYMLLYVLIEGFRKVICTFVFIYQRVLQNKNSFPTLL